MESNLSAASETVCDPMYSCIIVITEHIKQSTAVLTTFFLMMVVHRDIQEKIQAEIDAVVGKDRLPTIDDRPSLPFLDATFREIFRYCPTVPICGYLPPLSAYAADTPASGSPCYCGGGRV